MEGNPAESMVARGLAIYLPVSMPIPSHIYGINGARWNFRLNINASSNNNVSILILI